jgi:ribosomal protein S18 acetylase RimI-like enzyme
VTVVVRRATAADEAVLRELWEEFEREVPAPPEFQETWEEEWRDVEADIDERGVVLLAEDGEGVTGVLRAGLRAGGVWYVGSAYVRPPARRRGILRALLAEALRAGRDRGARRVTLEVLTDNEPAVQTWRGLGFETVQLAMAAPLDTVAARVERRAGATFGSIHVQTDARDRVQREVEKYRPRIAGPGETEVGPTRNGWVAVYDAVCEAEPALLHRLARELSYSTGAVVVAFTIEREEAVGYALFDHGSLVDEYLSVPELRGPLPPGDVIAFAANPRVVQRLTGADPAAVRAVARTAASSSELPPARELAAQIAATMGIAGADRGFGDAA